MYALEVAQHRALRADDLAEVDDLLLDVGDVADDLARSVLLEDVLLDRVELLADLAQHREEVVEGVVDDRVEQVAGALAEDAARAVSSWLLQRSKRYSTGCSASFGIVIT